MSKKSLTLMLVIWGLLLTSIIAPSSFLATLGLTLGSVLVVFSVFGVGICLFAVTYAKKEALKHALQESEEELKPFYLLERCCTDRRMQVLSLIGWSICLLAFASAGWVFTFLMVVAYITICLKLAVKLPEFMNEVRKGKALNRDSQENANSES